MWPRAGVQIELCVEVMDVLAPHAVGPAQVIVTEREELVEGVVSAVVRVVVAGGEIIAQPELGIHRLPLKW